jgi:hypothetical protein
MASEFITTAVKEARSIAKRREEASKRLSEARSALEEAQSAGADVSGAANSIKLATEALQSGEYDVAIDYTSQAVKQAQEEKEKKLSSAAPKAAAPAGGKAEGAPKCPSCGKKVKAQWKSCPFCRTRLK